MGHSTVTYLTLLYGMFPAMKIRTKESIINSWLTGWAVGWISKHLVDKIRQQRIPRLHTTQQRQCDTLEIPRKPIQY